jgi:hypothetical protein
MKTLSTEAFQKARAFIRESARPVEQALFAYEFEDGCAEDVWDAVGLFANRDGGFGHGMEPDCRLPFSSCLATTTALPYLAETGATAEQPLVAGAIQYLLDSYDSSLGGWLIVPPEVNAYPRAFWWQYDEEQARKRVKEGWANPSASVAAYLNAYSELVPPRLIESVNREAMEVSADPDMLADGHGFLCYTEFAKYAPEGEIVWERLKAVAKQAVATDPTDWEGYGVRPLWAVPDPSSPLMAVLGEAVQTHLDYELDQQQEDGSWHPFWEWGRFASDWKKARIEWQGVLTLKNLRALRAHGRIQGG